ncbi:MAG: GrpB family protein, partial [Phormidesmis sp.]
VVELVSYDITWPAQFKAEKVILREALDQWLAGSIEHVGSTAVPGLVAKPIIDIMAPVRSLEESTAAIEAAIAVGYVYYPYKADIMHWFCKPSPVHRTHHLHLVPQNSGLWSDRLLFRDELRRRKALASEYAILKQQVAKEFALDREAYTKAKKPFVDRVLAIARNPGNVQRME